jgi:sugar phosphate isomerase/epimerase
MNTAKKHGYDGWYSVEFEGETGDQPDGIRRTVELLEQNE